MPSVTIRGGFLRQQKTNEQNDRVLLHFVKPFILFPWHLVWHLRRGRAAGDVGPYHAHPAHPW